MYEHVTYVLCHQFNVLWDRYSTAIYQGFHMLTQNIKISVTNTKVHIKFGAHKEFPE
jgi:hypothetical protein